MRLQPSPLHLFFATASFFLFLNYHSAAYSVSNFQYEYHHGQNFITWTNASASNLQYNLYRSTVPLLLPSQLNSTTFLGFVRDHSAENFFWESETGDTEYYRITDGGVPLDASQGLYVVTCADALAYYYVITVTDLSSGIEDQTILPGINANLLPIADVVAKPRPVFQDSVQTNNGEWKKVYTFFVDNRETPKFPALNSTGSYGFSFFTLKRGNASKYPLFLIFQGIGKDDDKNINLDDSQFNNCYVIGLFDWLPIPVDGGGIGDNDFFIGYHEDFNIYSNTGPVPTTGIVKTYTQKLIWEEVNWLESQVPIDTFRLYCKGSSAEGYGALMTAALAPEKIAAVYGIVEPNSTSAGTDLYKAMWGTSAVKLNTDRVKYGTTDTLVFTDLKDIQKLINYNRTRSVPPIYDIHGKDDVSVPWNDGKIKWYDSLENNHYGGAWYWDGRDHGGNGSTFLSTETEPDYYRFATNVSYPAFSNCSIDQDPGDGTPSVGDAYGALNGYLDWNDANIKDKSCSYQIHLFIKDFYAGGVLDPEQYTTCTADVTIRRYQHFGPTDGVTIKWSNFDDATGVKIQSGTFTYSGGLLTVPGMIIKKTGCRLKLKIKNCTLKTEAGDEDETESPIVYLARNMNGYTAYLTSPGETAVQFQLYDLMGRMRWTAHMQVHAGTNPIAIPALGSGIYLLQVHSDEFNWSGKLLY